MRQPALRCRNVVVSLVLVCTLASGQTKLMNFEDFLGRHTSSIFSNEKDSLFKLFWRQALERGIPYIDSNNTGVTFLYRGSADSVKVYGDFTSWAFKLKMKKLPETDLQYLRLSFHSDARLDYKLVVNDKEIPDPLNKAVVPGGIGDKSELTMPAFERAPELRDQPRVTKGSLTTLTHASTTLGYNHAIHVYVPAGYAGESRQYPVAYFHDGGDYLTFAGATKILDNMIDAKSLPPMIAVFVVPPIERTRNRITEYAMNHAYADFFANELVPFVDRKFRTIRNPRQRFLVGSSYGGLISLFIGFRYSDTIGVVASQSGYVSFGNDSLHALFRDEGRKPLRLYTGIGTYERSIGGVASAEGDFLASSRRFNRLLDQKKYLHEYREFHDGHSWARWRNELPYIFRWFFSSSDKQ